MTALEVNDLPLKDLRKHIENRDISCSELAESAIAAVQQINPSLNAIIHFEPAFVRSQAAEADRRVKAGERGAWLGIPVTVKDNLWIKGRPATNGSLLYKDFVAPTDALAVARLRAGGAVVLGSTNCSEFACKGVTTNLVHGATRNPWDLNRTPGGSSGGAAAATSSGLGHVAIATDAGGSVRRPAAHSGVVGMKPTSGMIPHADGFYEPVYGNSVIGIMARCVADVIDMMELLAKPNLADPQSSFCCQSSSRYPFDRAIAKRDRLSHIAYSPRLGLGFAVDPEINNAVRAATIALTEAGHTVEEVDPEWPEGTSEEALMPLQLAGLAAIYGERFKQGAWQADPDIARQIEAGLSLSGRVVAEALELRKAMYGALHKLHQRFDVLITPTTAATAWPLDMLAPDHIEGKLASPRGHAVFTPIFNHCFVPACSVPCGLDQLKLPIGLQISGPRFSDARILSLAAAVEAASPHDFSAPKRGRTL